jgi:hypothetical protein
MTKYDIQRCLAIILAFTARVDGRYGPLQPANMAGEISLSLKSGAIEVTKMIINT